MCDCSGVDEGREQLRPWRRYNYKAAEVKSGYLCHRGFLSTLLGTDILQSRGYTTPRVHTDILLHSQCQTGLGHMLSKEEVFNDKNAQCCRAAIPVMSACV